MDWWACGVTFYACAVRQHLFNGHDRADIFARILRHDVDLTPLVRACPRLADLVGKLLVQVISRPLFTAYLGPYLPPI